jgi:hypothetical protein
VSGFGGGLDGVGFFWHDQPIKSSITRLINQTDGNIFTASAECFDSLFEQLNIFFLSINVKSATVIATIEVEQGSILPFKHSKLRSKVDSGDCFARFISPSALS